MKHTKPHSSHLNLPTSVPEASSLQTLARLLRHHAPYDHLFDLPLPGVTVVRASQVNADPFHAVYRPSVCIVAQGFKRALLESEAFIYDPLHMLVCTLNLPVGSQVIQASKEEPFLCLRLDLNAEKIAELSLRAHPQGLPPVPADRGVYLGQATEQIVDAAIRLLRLMEEPREAPLMAPLVTDEILLRMLRGPLGSRLAQVGQMDSVVQRISRAVEHIRKHFDEPLMLPELAEEAHMGVSSFHLHFKTVTSMSPLQFQKSLRLQEARRLMLTQGMDASTASREVGYGSVSQFTREYSRHFGQTPRRDILLLRDQGPEPSALN